MPGRPTVPLTLSTTTSIPVTALNVPRSSEPSPGNRVRAQSSAVQSGSTRIPNPARPSTTCVRATKSAAHCIRSTTVISVVAAACPAAAVMVAVPSATAVISPASSTRATRSSLLAQVTETPVMTWPFWSRTSAASCSVSPGEISSGVSGVTVTVVGTGAGGGGLGAGAGGGRRSGVVATHGPEEREQPGRQHGEGPASDHSPVSPGSGAPPPK